VRVLVTGASGFVGAHVARRLAEDGAEVRGLSRSEPPEEARVAEHFAADIRDSAALARAVEGCDAVVHVAALYAYGRSDEAAMEAVNVEGTRAVLDAAGGRRVVVTSSSATCGPVAGRPATEADAPPDWELRVPYKRTKLAAERVALERARAGADVVLVNPTTVVGPGDRRPTPSGKMVRDVATGRIGGYMRGGGINAVAVGDVAAGHALALQRGRAGERYILGGDDLSLQEAFAIVARRAGRRPPRIPVPFPMALAAAHAAALASRITRREPDLLVLDEVRLARLPLWFSSEKAKQELGYDPRPARQALEEATDWFLGGQGAGWSSGSAGGRSSSRARRSAVDSART
jgi:dihydroflavonol-4-reductase